MPPPTNPPIIVDYYIQLENLLEGRSSASILDLKMGTSTVTCNIVGTTRLKKRHEKDKSTTTAKLGLRVIGYVIKSREKEIEEKYYKFRDKRKRDTRCISLGVRVVPTAQGEHIMVGYSDNNVYGK